MPAGQVGDNGRMRHNGNQGILAGLVEGGIVLGQDQQDFVVPPGKVLLRHTEVVFRVAEKVDHMVFIGFGEQLQHSAAQLFHNRFLPLGKTVCFLFHHRPFHQALEKGERKNR